MTLLEGPLQVGDVLAHRYVLVEVVSTQGPATLWRANDETLARTVAVKVVPTPTKAHRDAAAAFIEAAVRTCAVNHAGLARVYDATLETRPGRGNDVAYVISEWVDGEPLDHHLEQIGALAAPDAADVLRQAADALIAAHQGGLIHGRLHPRNVLITSSGRVRLTDAAVAAALHGLPVPGLASREGIRADTRDLAAILYALVTARWPAAVSEQPPGSLAPAPVSDGHLMTARQVRAGVPRALDHVISRGLVPGIVGAHAPGQSPLSTPAALADAADASVAESRVARTEPAAAGAPRWRTALPWIAASVLVLVVAALGWFLGLAVGDLHRQPNAVDAIVSTTEPPASGAPTAPAIDLSKAVVHDFDPQGDRQENGDQVRNAVDLFPNTTWSTDRYKSATFGGLKTGVGLLLDLGSVHELHVVKVGFSAPGAQVELRVSNTPPPATRGAADALAVVAAAHDGAQVATLTPAAGTHARFVLIWITSLPKQGDGYGVGISELRIA